MILFVISFKPFEKILKRKEMLAFQSWCVFYGTPGIIQRDNLGRKCIWKNIGRIHNFPLHDDLGRYFCTIGWIPKFPLSVTPSVSEFSFPGEKQTPVSNSRRGILAGKKILTRQLNLGETWPAHWGNFAGNFPFIASVGRYVFIMDCYLHQ